MTRHARFALEPPNRSIRLQEHHKDFSGFLVISVSNVQAKWYQTRASLCTDRSIKVTEFSIILIIMSSTLQTKIYLIVIHSLLCHYLFWTAPFPVKVTAVYQPWWRPWLVGRCCRCTCGCFASPETGRQWAELRVTRRPRGNTYFRMPALCSDRTSRYEQQHTAHRDGKVREAVCMTNLLLCASS